MFKPLGHKNYGSIPHLSNSRLGEGDHFCSPGQERVATLKLRDKNDSIVVSEKLDGANCGIYFKNGKLIPLTRNGYIASESKFQCHLEFAKWVEENTKRFIGILNDGERIVGEWLSHAHGTIYNLPHEPYVVFDVMIGQKRLPYEELKIICDTVDLTMPHVISTNPITTDEALKILGEKGFHGADKAEGFVYRVEKKNKFDFMVKYVRPDKKDGIYMKEGIRNTY